MALRGTGSKPQAVAVFPLDCSGVEMDVASARNGQADKCKMTVVVKSSGIPFWDRCTTHFSLLWVKNSGIPFWLVGEFTTHSRTYWLLNHGQTGAGSENGVEEPRTCGLFGICFHSSSRCAARNCSHLPGRRAMCTKCSWDCVRHVFVPGMPSKKSLGLEVLAQPAPPGPAGSSADSLALAARDLCTTGGLRRPWDGERVGWFFVSDLWVKTNSHQELDRIF